MKAYFIVIIFLFLSHAASSQSDSIHKCPPGYSWMPTIGTSSLMILANDCFHDSVVKRMWIAFRKNMCGEMGFMMIGENHSYSRFGTWVNDSIGCVWKETFEKKIKGKWVEISCVEYYNLPDVNCWTYTTEGNKKEKCKCD